MNNIDQSNKETSIAVKVHNNNNNKLYLFIANQETNARVQVYHINNYRYAAMHIYNGRTLRSRHQ